MENKSGRRTPLTAIGAITVHPKRQNISFGRWAMPVMAQKMQESDPLDRKRAVQSLSDYVYDSRRVASKEFASVVPRLKSLHLDEDTEVRLKVAECLGAVAVGAAGRRTFHKHDFYGETLKLVEDEDEAVRQAALTAVHRVCLSPVGAEAMVEAGAIEILIRRLPHESKFILVTLLQGLHSCCLVDRHRALVAKGLDALVPLLDKDCPKIKAETAMVIKELTVEAEGRLEALKLSAMTRLVELCLEEKDYVKAKALAAIMMIVNTIAGKYAALDHGAISKVFPLLQSDIVEVRVNAIKVLTALGEAPEGRSILVKDLSTILKLLNDDCKEIRKAAEKMIEVVTFVP